MAMSSVSVVTNALRLRRFRRPASAAEILHPPLRARVGDWAYLGGIALVALAVGIAALAFAPEQSEAGMVMDEAETAAAASLVPDRTVRIDATDDLRFTPAEIDVTQGETVAFVVTNPGALPHEFVIGDEAVQAEHEQEMADGEEEMEEMGDEPYAIDVPPGETATLVYTFEEPGTTLVGCHVPGHYDAGMRGTITVTDAAAGA
jgi:uncharacterized cupredoxin-like copper-binding protein